MSIVDVAGGRNHAIALTAGGNVYAWGSNQYGQLGNGTWQNSSTPVLVSSLTDVVGIFAGRDHNLAVRERRVRVELGVQRARRAGRRHEHEPERAGSRRAD